MTLFVHTVTGTKGVPVAYNSAVVMIDAVWHDNFSVALIMLSASVLGRSIVECVAMPEDCKR